MLDARAVRQRTTDRRVLATVWWYSLSAALLTPVLIGLVTGRPLSPRLADTRLHVLSGPTPVAATTGAARTADVGEELRASLAAVVGAVAEAGGLRPRPLWGLATDSLANRLIALGRAVGDVDAASALAEIRAALATLPEGCTPRRATGPGCPPAGGSAWTSRSPRSPSCATGWTSASAAAASRWTAAPCATPATRWPPRGPGRGGCPRRCGGCRR